MAANAFCTSLMIIVCVFYQCSRTCGEGLQYRQVDCMRKYPNGTKLFAIDCDINEVPNLVRPCYNQPCGKSFLSFPYFLLIFALTYHLY